MPVVDMSDQMLKNGLLYGLEKPSSYATLEEESVRTINESLRKYPNAAKLFQMLQEDAETNALLGLANYIAVRKLGYNDHGPVHARIVTANGMKLLRIILDSKSLEIDSINGLGMNEDDAHLIVMAGCFLHDIGNAVTREDHEYFSVVYGKNILERLLPSIYPDVQKRTVVIEQVLHALYAHDVAENALTIESAIVVIADGCDITKGRGRLAFNLGKHDIHSISALSIESVDIKKGKNKLIEITVHMSNSAGIYQVQETLGNKVAKSPLKDYIEIVALLQPSKMPAELQVLDRIVFSDGKYRQA
jgi:metal-dependent HD superfamily phosphatase/phosphodiesterase